MLFARFDEADKCELIRSNAPEEASSSEDDNAGVLIKETGPGEQAREVLVSAALLESLSIGAARIVSGSGLGLPHQCMHCATRQQACKAEAAAAVHPLRLPQPQSLPEPQSQSLAEARARSDAQHAKAKQAQDEYRRLQLDFAQQQQHCRSKDVARARLLCASAGYLQLAQLGSPREMK